MLALKPKDIILILLRRKVMTFKKGRKRLKTMKTAKEIPEDKTTTSMDKITPSTKHPKLTN
jgi:hypothetical protein